MPLPDSNPKSGPGRLKPPVRFIPPVAILQLGLAMENGGFKYGMFNWREHRVSSSIYYDAAFRHLMSWWDGEDLDAESGLPHLAHVMACMAILLDAIHTGRLNDDRHKPTVNNGLPNVSDFIRAKTAQRASSTADDELKGNPWTPSSLAS